MITIEKFRLKFVPEVNRWLKVRDHISFKQSDLPEIGFIAFNKNRPVCVAFLRMVEGNLAMIDSVGSNPDIEKDTRDEALDSIVKILLETAKHKKIHTVFSHTKLDCIIKRSEKHGFSVIPQKLIAIKLEE